jgi:hypothetical protein
MAEEKKGNAKITIEIEVNEALMESIKGCVAMMPEMMKKLRKKD